MMLGAEAVVRYLEAEGIRYLFGNPGTTEVGIMDALVDSTLEYILVLQENAAVAAADGLSQATGRATVVNLHTGPGLAQGFSSLYMASRHRAPVVVTAGNEYTEFAMSEPLLQADLVRMAEPLVKWAFEPKTPAQLIPGLRRAFKVAQTPPRGPVFVSIPLDLQRAEIEEVDLSPSRVPAGPAPDSASVERAARLLAEATNPCIIAGDDVGRTRSVDELVSVAEKLGARVYAAPLSLFQPFPNRHPLFAGAMPSFPAIMANMLAPHDVVMVVGAPVFYLYYYQPGRALPETSKLIHVHPDGWELDKNFPSEVACIATADRFLKALSDAWDELPEARRAGAAERAKTALSEIEERRSERRSEAPKEGPLTPQSVVAAMVEAGRDDLTIVDESVTSSGAARQGVDLQNEESFFGHKGGALGWGAGAALGVALGLPTRRVVATIGDGSMMYAPQALWTAAHHSVPVTYVILNNAGYAIIKAGTQALQGRAAQTGKFIGMDLDAPEISYVSLAESMGVPGTRVTSNEMLPAAFEKAFSTDGPYLIDAVLGSNGGRTTRLPV